MAARAVGTVVALSTLNVEVERLAVMKRLFVVAVALIALVLPTLTFAQGVKTVYRPEVHGTIIVLPETPVAPIVKAEKAKRTPAEVIARHEAMANAYRNATRVNYSAVAHCERGAAKAREELRKSAGVYEHPGAGAVRAGRM
jgi:hypothetical protein